MKKRMARCAFGTMGLLLACSAGDGNDGAGSFQGNNGGNNGSPVVPGSGLTGGVQAPGTMPGSQNAGSLPPGNANTGGGMSLPAGPSAPTSSASSVPCDIASIVSEHCTLCHGSTPQFSAPMSLMSAADFQVMAPVATSETVGAAALRRINATDTSRLMPPPGTVSGLDAAELAAFTAWLEGGAQQEVADGCAITEPGAPNGGGGGGLAPSGGGGPVPTGISFEPYDGWDSGDVECYRFVAHANGNKDTPYPVGTAVDEYVGFSFVPPWQGTRYTRAMRNVIDNTQALHHWLLYEVGPVIDGSVASSSGAHPDGTLMGGWAPGGYDVYNPPDSGMEMSSSRGYLLEVHYNSNNPSAVDASGVEVCVTSTPPANVSSVSWLGTDAISGTSATGVCRPNSNQRIHITSGSPHMHLKGRHMKVTVTRANGTQEVVHDEPFDFENQRMYPEDLWLEPGDSITTTCTFSQFATFGPGTNQEMCYWFAGYYPKGTLVDGGLIGTLIHGGNACLGM